MTEQQDKILVVDDDARLRSLLQRFLEEAGYAVKAVGDAEQMDRALSRELYSLMVLDLMLPGEDGYSFCQYLRKELALDLPVIFMTARDQLEDKLEGFDRGGDDYIVKPFALPELAARVSALIRRQRKEVTANTLQVADLQLDPARQEVRRDGQLLKLSPTAFRILRILMRESPKVVSREQLEHELWGDLVPDSDALRSHLYNLRKAVDKPFENALLNTLPGVGFSIQEDRPTAG